MKRSTIEAEMAKRDRVDDTTYGMIGTELKRLRTSQSQTLSSVAGDICSVSYLCKIEKAQMKPNRYMLHQICKKLQLDEPKMDILFELKQNTIDMVHSYYYKDTSKIFSIYSECNEFDNYRSKLICFIYSLYTYELDIASSNAEKLFKLTSVMMSDELAIFMTFYSVLCYYQENYTEAIENLKYIIKQPYEEVVIRIAKYQLLLCYFKLNHPLTLVYGKELESTYLNTSEFQRADYVKYLIGIYQVRNHMVESALEMIELLQNVNYKKSLEFFCDYQLNRLKKDTYYNYLRPFARMVHTYVFHKKNYITMFLKLEKIHFLECDFSYNIANYLTLETDEEKINELENVIIPNLAFTNNRYEIEFFLQELCQISTRMTRYKFFCKTFARLLGENKI